MNRSDFIKALRMLCAAYPNFKPEPATFEIYYRILRDVPDQLLDAGMAKAAAESEYMPTAARIRRCAFEVRDAISRRPTAYEAWGEVVAAFAAIGSYRIPEWSHPAVEMAVRQVGGWTYLCTSENMVADRARFVECYEAISKREVEQSRMLPEIKQLVDKMRADKKLLGAPEVMYASGTVPSPAEIDREVRRQFVGDNLD